MTRPTPTKFLRKFRRNFRGGGHHIAYVLRQKRGCRLVRYDVFCPGHRYRGQWKPGRAWTTYHVETWAVGCYRGSQPLRPHWAEYVSTKDARWARECFNKE